MAGAMETFHPSYTDIHENSPADIDVKPELPNYSPPTNSNRTDPASANPTSTTPTPPDIGNLPPTSVIPQSEDLQTEPNPLLVDMVESPNTQSNPAATPDEIELSDEMLNQLLAESTPIPQAQQAQQDIISADDAEKKTVYPIWIHKADYRPITREEGDALKSDMMKNFLALARSGELTIDFRFTSKFSDLQSGKMKLTSESPQAAEAIKRILSCMPFWRVLAAEDLSTQEGKTFWTFCPSVCQDFVLENSLNELIRAHTGWFLEQNDIRTALPPKKIKETTNHLCYLFLSYKAQRYFHYFNWKISLLGCTLKLQEYGEKRDSTPTLTKDNSPQDLVQS